MAIDAIVANMDHVWSAFNDAQDDDNSERQSDEVFVYQRR